MQRIEGAVLGERTESSVSYSTAAGTVRLEARDARTVRVRLGEAAALRYVADAGGPPARLELEPGEPAVLRTASFALTVSTKPFRIALSGAGGETLLGDGTLVAPSPGEDGRLQLRFSVPQGQHFYGLGHGGQQLDRLGGARQLWNSHVGRGPGSDIAIPLIVSNRGWGLFVDNTADARVTIGRSDGGLRLVYDAEGGGIDFYLLVAASPRELMGVVAALLGRPLMPPRWFLGYLQSTRHFEGTEELRGLGSELRSRRIPCDALIFLSTYGEALGWNRMVGHLELQGELWKDPHALIEEMRGQRFEIMTHEYPVLHPEARGFAEASSRGYLLEEGYAKAAPATRPPATYQEGQRYIDFSKPEARRWWWEQHRGLRELGVASWWLDGGEGPPASARLAAGDGRGLHNAFDLLRMRAFAEGEAADRPELRPVLLCRSGAAGMQRYGAACWSGDIDNTFATLAAQVPLGLNTGVSGVPYWGTDIGGFFHPVPETGELFARWFQFGAFCPVFRCHGRVWREHLPWAHGAEVEAICRAYAELRYRLLPYTYSLARQASELGLPLMRPLWLNYPDDPRVWDLGSEYLWGDDLLVAPVTREGARHWPVYLPAGAWYDFWTGERYEGGRAVEVAAPLERMPLFVRAGAIVPTGPVMQHSGERPLEEVSLLVYPGEAGSFELYEDDGRSNAYRHGAFATTELRCGSDGGAAIVEIGEPRGDARLVPAGRTYSLRVRSDGVSRVELASGGRTRELASRAEGGFVSVSLGARAGRVVLRP